MRTLNLLDENPKKFQNENTKLFKNSYETFLKQLREQLRKISKNGYEFSKTKNSKLNRKCCHDNKTI